MELKNITSMGTYFLVLVLINFSRHASAGKNFGNQTDRLALLEFKKRISGDPHGILNFWNDSQHHCNWQGIMCNFKHQRVTVLNLGGLSLSGTISPHIGNLTFLRFISLANNKLYHEIPQEIGRLFRLRHLNLTDNMLEGGIPVNLSRCLDLKNISIARNRLIGNIPHELGALQKLEELSLFTNNLTGEIPSSLGNLTSLIRLSIPFNNLQGRIPDSLSRLIKLKIFRISSNNLSGTIPPSIYNMSSIEDFSTAGNSFTGSLPENIGLTLPNLRAFGVGLNKFDGTIPVSFGNASKLVILDLSGNFFSGKVPTNLGFLQNLQFLNLEDNPLGSNSTSDLNFIESLSNCSVLSALSLSGNNFGGELPNTIGNLSDELKMLLLGENQISGSIPAGLENLGNLYLLAIDNNLFSGSIPEYFGRFKNMQSLSMAGNRLEGEIPSSLCNLTSVYRLDISNNRLNGKVPENIEMCQYLKELDMSHNSLVGEIPYQLFSLLSLSTILNISANSFTGSLPPQVGKLQNVGILDISQNNLSGEVPKSLGDCSSLEHLVLRSNYFQGNIPSSLASLKGIQYLDLSNNNFTGEIPQDLEKLSFLKYLNLSYNNLVGEVPKDGVFANASLISLVGNSKLCGGISEMGLLPCPSLSRKRKLKPKVIMIIAIISGTLIIIMVLACLSIFYYRKKQKQRSSISISISSSPVQPEKLLKISYNELRQATGGFSSENLIGSGGFGSVYKGTLIGDEKEERLVAVKVLDLRKNGASKSFQAECRALRNTRHRNLLRIITYCSSIDHKGNDFKALVYEYMENGNLDTWLHQSATSPSLLQRLNIAIDVASALQYLHNESEIQIVHCDLKPSNILLDEDMVAHLGDFGLAKLVSEISVRSSLQQLDSIAIKGTIGYVAPEYGMGGEISSQGDVYSYGILLLELFTGKIPTDAMFVNGLNLFDYVSMALTEDDVMKIVDKPLLAYHEKEEEDVANYEENPKKLEYMKQCLVSVFKVGLLCSTISPKERPHMNDVRKELLVTRETFHGARKN